MVGERDLAALEDERDGAVLVAEVREHGGPPLEPRFAVQRLERPQLGHLTVADRAARPHELLARPPGDFFGAELLPERLDQLVDAFARLPRAPELELLTELVERRAERVEPGDHV